MSSRRPRLSGQVAARRHLVDGRPLVVLHVLQSERTAVIGAREWDVLRGADGSRDLDGIIAAARHHGRHIGRAQLEAFVDGLDAAGMLVEGPELPPDGGSPGASRPALPLLQLPGFALRCDGQGTCCRLYPTTLLSAREATRARALLPDVLDAGDEEARAFSPRRGGVLAPWQPRAATMVNGRCSYLDGAGRCRLHSAAGASAKPAGCRLFPLTFAADGAVVRVSVAPECSCVFDSLAQLPKGPGGLLDADLISSDQLPAEVWIEPAPSAIRVSGGTCWAPDDYGRLRAQLLALAGRPQIDLARRLWRLGQRLQAAPEDIDGVLALAAEPARSGLLRSGWAAAFEQRLRHSSRQHAGWRSAADLTRHVFQWLQQATAAAGAEPAPAHDAVDERFYLRATAFGDLWLREGEPPLAQALQQRAVRLWLARAGRATPAPAYADDPAWRQPLALVEALVRGYGLQGAAGEGAPAAADGPPAAVEA